MMSDDSEESEPKLVDFGFAKIVGPGQTDCDFFGSQGYAAPEVVTKSDYALQADIWSLGVILFALYCGALPFASYDKKEMDRMVLEDPLDLDRPALEKADKKAKNLLFRMLEKDPKSRATIEQVVNHKYYLN